MNIVGAIFGMRGTGKTEYLKGNESLKLPGLIKSYIKKGMKVLIVDTFDHPSYRDIPIIKEEQFTVWKRGCYRIYVNVDKMPELCTAIAEHLWNCLVVFEDSHKHQFRTIDRSIMRLIGDSKQKNIDILFMYHNWGLAPKDLYRYLDFIEVFKTKDHPAVRKDDMPGYYEQAEQVYNEVKAHNSRYYHKFLNTEL